MVPVTIFVSVMYYALLAGPMFSDPESTSGDKIRSIHLHTANFLLVIIELFACTIPIYPSKTQFWIPSLFMLMYGIGITIAHVAGSLLWPYTFMYSLFGTFGKNISWLYIGAFTAACMVLMTLLHFVMLLMIKMKLKFQGKVESSLQTDNKLEQGV
jgi:hypothetical protein